MSKPICVITGDVHFTPGTIELASEVIKQVLTKAHSMGVPAILNGDILDGKAIMRAECVNRLIDLVSSWSEVQIYVNRGNHDQLSEKTEENSLDFLKPYACVINKPTYIGCLESYIVPYHSDSEKLEKYLNMLPDGARLIMHQGLMGASLGHYVVDKSSLDKHCFSQFRVIASHYHKAQNIKCGPPKKNAVGLWSYVGSPYSLSFGEANDGPKGYAILMDDGTLVRVPTNLRKHVVLETTTDKLPYLYMEDPVSAPGDLVWLKVSGPASQLDALNKAEIAKALGISSFKLDKIYDETVTLEPKKEVQTEEELFDSIIDGTTETPQQKEYLKKTWREIV